VAREALTGNDTRQVALDSLGMLRQEFGRPFEARREPASKIGLGTQERSRRRTRSKAIQRRPVSRQRPGVRLTQGTQGTLFESG
jgi:hypothetical protein